MGYAPSTPELAGTFSTAAKGLLGVRLWDVTASNMSNVGLIYTIAIIVILLVTL